MDILVLILVNPDSTQVEDKEWLSSIAMKLWVRIDENKVLVDSSKSDHNTVFCS